jgi:phospholipase C
MPISRREFLKTASAGTGLGLLPTAVRAALAGPSVSGTLGSIAHVVIFSQENRSFDHYFGTLRGVQGYGDPHPPSIQNAGRSVFFQPRDEGGWVGPWALDSASTAAQCVADVLHDWKNQQGTWNKGRMDRWAALNGPLAMSHYRRADLPWHYALADAFTVCDQFFASIRSSTSPNRLYLMSGMIDAAERHGDAVITNSFAAGKLAWTTYPERLQQAGISWRVYQEEDNYDDNALAWFRQFAEAPEGSPLHDNGMKRRVFADFVADVENGRLPAVSWIIAPTAESEHPPFSPARGAHYVNRYLQALAANRKVWQKTAFILAYDENGGLFDHVPPPAPAPGTAEEFINGIGLGLGARMPAIVCSPWSRGGWVASEVFDLTSTLRFLERWTGVAEPNISAWRRKVCGDLTSCFDFGVADYAFPGLPDTAALASAADRQCAELPEPTPPAGESPLPAQEPGQRPMRVQPYGLECWLTGHPARLGGGIRVHWRNAGSGAAALRIHPRAFRGDGPWFYLAEAGGEGEDFFRCGWPVDDRYDLELFGPNRFYRRFRGCCRFGAAPEPAIRLETPGPGQPAVIHALNTGDSAVTLTVLQRNGDNSAPRTWSLQLPPGETVRRQFPTEDDWYDYAVSLEGNGDFRQELAGHVEGKPGLTAPALFR